MKVGIIGYGHVGKAMHVLFTDAALYDEPLDIGTKQDINNCNIAFICVPTPMADSGKCDTSIVEEVISWCAAEILVIRSTVYVGFTDKMCEKYNKNIIFQPEYYGETAAHPFADLANRSWLSFGGNNDEVISKVIELYKTVYNSNIKIYITDAKTAELAKYMENSFYAVKVTFCNEFYDIAKKLHVNYDKVREVWLADPRIGSSHTFVYEDNRGYGGKCLPKDIASIIYQADEVNADAALLKATVEKNIKLRSINSNNM